MSPEAGSAFQMSEGENTDVLAGESVHDLVGESGNEHPACGGCCPDRPCLRVVSDAVESREGGLIELAPEAKPLTLIPRNSGCQFLGGRLGCPYSSAHRPRISLSMRRLTSSQDSNSIAPASIAWTRREISCSQADSASWSVGPSKLAKTSTATSARSSGPRRRASARTALAALVMPKMIRPATPPYKRVNLTVRPVTVRACARAAPTHPAADRRR